MSRPGRYTSMDRIRDYYGLTVKRGDRVRYDGRMGTVRGCVRNGNMHLSVLLDGDSQPVAVHPTWRMEYGV